MASWCVWGGLWLRAERPLGCLSKGLSQRLTSLPHFPMVPEVAAGFCVENLS